MHQAALIVALGFAAPFVGLAQTLPRIEIVATGGTIAGEQASTGQHGYKSGAFDIETLIEGVPQLKKIASITGQQFASIGSQDMNDEVWLELSRRLNTLAANSNIDGIVVTHGTDTMEETSWFIDLTVRSSKPIVFTGSMRPATAISPDGPMNLYNAVAVAGDKQACNRGVMVVMNDTIWSARDVYKFDTSRVDAFRALDRGPLGTVDTGHANFTEPAGATPHQTFDVSELHTLPKVFILYAASNMGRELIYAAVAAGAKGIVIAGVGNGNVTTPAMQALAEASSKGVVVVRSTRLPEGAIMRNAEIDDDKLGFVVSDSFKPGKARILLQLALLKTSDPKEVQRIFNEY